MEPPYQPMNNYQSLVNGNYQPQAGYGNQFSGPQSNQQGYSSQQAPNLQVVYQPPAQQMQPQQPVVAPGFIQPQSPQYNGAIVYPPTAAVQQPSQQRPGQPLHGQQLPDQQPQSVANGGVLWPGYPQPQPVVSQGQYPGAVQSGMHLNDHNDVPLPPMTNEKVLNRVRPYPDQSMPQSSQLQSPNTAAGYPGQQQQQQQPGGAVAQSNEKAAVRAKTKPAAQLPWQAAGMHSSVGAKKQPPDQRRTPPPPPEQTTSPTTTAHPQSDTGRKKPSEASSGRHDNSAAAAPAGHGRYVSEGGYINTAKQPHSDAPTNKQHQVQHAPDTAAAGVLTEPVDSSPLNQKYPPSSYRYFSNLYPQKTQDIFPPDSNSHLKPGYGFGEPSFNNMAPKYNSLGYPEYNRKTAWDSEPYRGPAAGLGSMYQYEDPGWYPYAFAGEYYDPGTTLCLCVYSCFHWYCVSSLVLRTVTGITCRHWYCMSSLVLHVVISVRQRDVL